ncbi:hypothetical protein MOQ_009739 [Trypanosoma cruzi marinkellei]|uniref:Target of rapamycin (TOR) kinase 1 n=1 Tax=Trypanosoma cruzi marinkellei TaxID=85056 RepID=K2MW25_TRYCR|nr:hypothetical protein MOQ_009739 [Trypanosoma cruzi marinkellei]
MQNALTQRKAHEYYDCPRGASSGFLECHGAFHKAGCVAARCSNRGDVQFGPTRDLAVGEARRPVRPFPEHGSILGEVHHNADPGVMAGRIDVKGEAAEGQEPWLRAEQRFFYNFYHHSATITRRAARTRSATTHDERTIPLQQQVNAPVLNPEWIKGRLNPATLQRLMQVWRLVGRFPFILYSSGKARESSRRISVADARILRAAGIIEDASSATTGGWIIPFLVVEGKTAGLRRRWIAWPRDMHRDDPYEADFSLLYIFHYLPPVVSEAASCLELKASFFKILFTAEDSAFLSMPRGGRTLVDPTQLPMGCKTGQGTLQIIITSTIVVVTTVVHPLRAATPLVRTDLWIDNIRITGSISDAALWEARVLCNADGCHATMGEDCESGATQYTFLGVQFDHTH